MDVGGIRVMKSSRARVRGERLTGRHPRRADYYLQFPQECPTIEPPLWTGHPSECMEKIVISSREVAETSPPPDEPVRLEPKLPPAVPWWAKLALSPLVLFLPLLCLVAVVLRVAMRGLPPRTRFAWTSLVATLLSVSGLITSVAVVLVMTLHPLPSLIGVGLADLDERTEFPALPVIAALSPRQASENLKPLVSVVSPARRTWFTHQVAPSAGFGAGTLLQADSDGYLFATARHVVDGLAWQSDRSDNSVLIAMASGAWGEGQVVARHRHQVLVCRGPRCSNVSCTVTSTSTRTSNASRCPVSSYGADTIR